MAPRSRKNDGVQKGDILAGLNAPQAEAVLHGPSPLLIIAGAGSGKTKTLAHRVAQLIADGANPGRILLLTFTRRSAAEMLRRVDALLRQLGKKPKARGAGKRIWGGTFHAIATRLLRQYGKSVGLDPAFTIHDRSDSEDLLNLVRTELGLIKTEKRFPKKRTCMSIYSHCVNSQRKLGQVLPEFFPWCEDYEKDLKRLFQGYIDRKEAGSVLDYDDLLLFWRELLTDSQGGDKVRGRFDHVLVDEYQDTNRLQAETLKLLRPDGTGMTVVGDDAQSIYSFRAATIRNILDFPKEFPGTKVLKLEQNYRSTQPILAATNSVISESDQRYAKELWSEREGGEKPRLVTCDDEEEQTAFVVEKILEHREAGIDLKNQAVLFRASHHSIVLETELARRNIPFVKYGGLKFMEAAHVKDLLAFLRLAENPADVIAGSRLLMLLPGVGPSAARRFMTSLIEAGCDFQIWSEAKVPAAARTYWPKLVRLLGKLAGAPDQEIPRQIHAVRRFYEPLLEEKYDNAESRLRDLEQLEVLAARFPDRQTMLAEIALDPPSNSGDFAGDPTLDEDYLILSTIHSAKGLEWDAVYVLHASDGNIPSDMATGTVEQIEEERRLFYVALTRAKHWLYVCFPLRFYNAYRSRFRDDYGYGKLTRFITNRVKRQFNCHPAETSADDEWDESSALVRRKKVRSRSRSIWS